jgi:hypothetical protein
MTGRSTKRPMGVEISSTLMALEICVGVVLILSMPFLTIPPKRPSSLTPTEMTVLVRAMQVAFVAFQCFVVWFYWLGRPWARRVVLVASALYAGGFLIQCLGPFIYLAESRRHYSTADWFMGILETILAVFLLWYLNTCEVKAWFLELSQSGYSQNPAQRPTLP